MSRSPWRSCLAFPLHGLPGSQVAFASSLALEASSVNRVAHHQQRHRSAQLLFAVFEVGRHAPPFFQVPAIFFQLVAGGRLTGHGIEIGCVLRLVEGRELGEQPGALGCGLGDQPPAVAPGCHQVRLGELAQRVPDGIALQPGALHELADRQAPVAVGELQENLALALTADEGRETAEGRSACGCHLSTSFAWNDHRSIPCRRVARQGTPPNATISASTISASTISSRYPVVRNARSREVDLGRGWTHGSSRPIKAITPGCDRNLEGWGWGWEGCFLWETTTPVARNKGRCTRPQS